ncbi:sulfurtransferase TusA family protein [Candidatus Nitronereus thalassa]|uniref:Sulfurtransferase TusA family protein n=1 Tax=Candidatus Nitronereus thalassa TaxID=3020898 RepID=A0ABU3KCL9_9BACT|nr:sulfurtransferase TusA family protein [Candidatus Nitronereus thalassa]MDT7044260.1 sulfurtransferase TusA family protein [Candidatus Nitronereus thalassa]
MSNKIKVQTELDLRGVICPYNFVKTKLQLDRMQAGDILAVVLDDGEPIKNVPQSLRNEGHAVLIQEPYGVHHRILIQKGED